MPTQVSGRGRDGAMSRGGVRPDPSVSIPRFSSRDVPTKEGFYDQELEFRQQLRYPPRPGWRCDAPGRNDDKVKFSAGSPRQGDHGTSCRLA